MSDEGPQRSGWGFLRLVDGTDDATTQDPTQRTTTYTTLSGRVSRSRELTLALSLQSSAGQLCPGSARSPRNHTRARLSGRKRRPACAHGRERKEAPKIETKPFVLLQLFASRRRVRGPALRTPARPGRRYRTIQSVVSYPPSAQLSFSSSFTPWPDRSADGIAQDRATQYEIISCHAIDACSGSGAAPGTSTCTRRYQASSMLTRDGSQPGIPNCAMTQVWP